LTEGTLSEAFVGEGSAVAGTPFEAASDVHANGVLRLRDCSASRPNPSAQDDRASGIARVAQKFCEDRPQSRLFEAISLNLLRAGNGIRFQARGASMSPAIRDGEIVHVKSTPLAELRRGDIVLVKGEMGFRLHRLVVADTEQDVFITRGDCGQQDDPAVSGEQIVGIAAAKEVQIAGKKFRVKFRGTTGSLLRSVARGQRVLARILRFAI
jgi:hypothetical protein